MMKTFGLVLAMLVVLASASIAETVTFDMYVGWETVACPVVPFNPEPSAVFNGLDFEGGNPIVQRYDPAVGFKTYDYWSQPDTYFGNILLGEGYQVQNDGMASGVNTVDGVPDGVPDANGKTDMWISLPKAGYSLIGFPFNTPVDIDQDTGAPIWFTDGTDMVLWSAAIGKGWIDSDNIQRWAGPTWAYAGMNWSGEEQLLPGKAYWIYTKVDNLAMVIEAPL